jgi:hypothetical protein
VPNSRPLLRRGSLAWRLCGLRRMRRRRLPGRGRGFPLSLTLSPSLHLALVCLGSHVLVGRVRREGEEEKEGFLSPILSPSAAAAADVSAAVKSGFWRGRTNPRPTEAGVGVGSFLLLKPCPVRIPI